MSSKLPWTRLNADKWLFTLCFLSPTEKCIYVMLRLLMLYTGGPISKDLRALALWVGYPVKEFETALNSLIEGGFIIRLEDGRLWNLEVEEELTNSHENLEKVSKTSRSKRLSERAQKAAQARWGKQKSDACDMLNDAKHDAKAMLNDAYIYNNNINNNKKNKNIILSKREIEFENLETTDLLEKPIECDDVQSEEIKTIETKQPITHKQNINLSNEANNRWQVVDYRMILNPITILHLQRACHQSVSKSRLQNFEITGVQKLEQTLPKSIGKRHGVIG